MEQERYQMNPKDQWDLSTLYENDEAFEQDLARMDADTDAVVAFEGKLRDAETIAKFYQAMTALQRRMNNLLTYAMLRQSEDTRAPKAQELMAKGMNKAVLAESRCSFAEPEILALSEEKLKEIAEAKELVPYRFLFQELLDEKPHVLSAEAEQLLAGFSEVLEAPKTIADSLMDADLSFDSVKDREGNERELSQANFILLEQSEDRTLRENAFRSFYKGYASHGNTLAATYSGIVKSFAAQARARHYESSRAMALAGEHIPASVYDGLVESVRRHMPSMHRYVQLRKKLLGLDELHYYDVYVPLTQGLSAQDSWSYEEAKSLVLEGLSPLGREYTDQVRKAFDDRWIDVYPNAGKRGGAFSSGTYDSNPFILMSYTGDYESVSTIAHEMGHSMHTWYSKNHQPSYYADYTLFVAEVASICNEMLLVQYLIGKAKDAEEKKYLINYLLEQFRTTLYRQTMFAEFEVKAHGLKAEGQTLTAQQLCEIYYELNRQYFGPNVVIDKEIAMEWSRIPHFYTPFYVYQYATGFAAALAISGKILRGEENILAQYKTFLSGGCSMDCIDLLKLCGVDMTRPEPVREALSIFDKYLEEFGKLF